MIITSTTIKSLQTIMPIALVTKDLTKLALEVKVVLNLENRIRQDTSRRSGIGNISATGGVA